MPPDRVLEPSFNSLAPVGRSSPRLFLLDGLTGLLSLQQLGCLPMGRALPGDQPLIEHVRLASVRKPAFPSQGETIRRSSLSGYCSAADSDLVGATSSLRRPGGLLCAAQAEF
jgi:hypothetical protein